MANDKISAFSVVNEWKLSSHQTKTKCDCDSTRVKLDPRVRVSWISFERFNVTVDTGSFNGSLSVFRADGLDEKQSPITPFHSLDKNQTAHGRHRTLTTGRTQTFHVFDFAVRCLSLAGHTMTKHGAKLLLGQPGYLGSPPMGTLLTFVKEKRNQIPLTFSFPRFQRHWTSIMRGQVVSITTFRRVMNAVNWKLMTRELVGHPINMLHVFRLSTF